MRDNFQLRLAEEQQRKVADFLKKLIQKRASQLTNECVSSEMLSTHSTVVVMLKTSGALVANSKQRTGHCVLHHTPSKRSSVVSCMVNGSYTSRTRDISLPRLHGHEQ